MKIGTIKRGGVVCLSAALLGSLVAGACFIREGRASAQEIALSPQFFTSAVDLDGNSADPKYAPDANTRYTAESTEFWDFHDGVATSRSDMFTEERSYSNFVYLAYNTPMQYAEIEATIKQESTRVVNGNNTVNGWAGLYFGVEDTSRRPYWPDNPHGGVFFCQPQGFATYSGNVLNGSSWTEEKDGEKNRVNDYIPDQEMTHKLRIYKNHLEYYVNGNLFWDLSTADDFAVKAECGVFVTNQSFTVSAFSAKELAADGTDPSTPSSIDLPEIAGSVKPYQWIPFAPSVQPVTAARDFTVTSSPEGVDFDYISNLISFTHPGEYTVTVTSDAAPSVQAQTTVTVEEEEGLLAMPFDSPRLRPYYIPSGKPGVKGEPAEMDDLFTVKDGVLTRTPESDWDAEVSANYTTLYFGGLPSVNFSVGYVAKTDGADAWHGLVFANSDESRAGNQSGATLFLQRNGKSTYWSGSDSALGDVGPVETDGAPALYIPNGYNRFLFKVYGRAGNYTAEMFVNDFETPTLKRTGLSDVSGAFGIFFSGLVTAEVRNLQYGFLREDGTVIPYVPASGVAFGEKPAEMEVGDSVLLTAEVLPAAATNQAVVFSSDAPHVAQVDDAGNLRALSAGEAVIRVISQDNGELADSFTLTVKESLVEVTGISIKNKSAFSAMEVGGANVRIEVEILPAGAIDPDLVFSSSDESVATVTTAGTVVAVGAGTATITVTASNGKTDSVTVTVLAPSEEGGGGEKGCGSALTGAAAILLAMSLVPIAIRKQHGE